MKESALTTLARVLRRRMWIAIACAVIVPATAFAYSSMQEKEYSATASLLFRDPGFAQKLFGTSFFTPSSDPDREAATNLRLVSLGVVAGRTADRLGGGLTRREVAKSVEAESAGQSNVVAITATAESPRQAARLANTFAEEYIAFRRDADRLKIEETLGIIRSQLAALEPTELTGDRARQLQQQEGQLELLRSLQTGNAELVQPADLPTNPSSPQTTRNVIVGIIAGLMLGLGMAFLVDRFDRRLRDLDEVREIFQRPILAQVPKDRELGKREWGGGQLSPVVAETFHMLRANLRYSHSREEIESVVVTSALPEEGKTTVSWNLAVAAAGTGNRVLLIETDLRKPDLASHLDIPRAPGLSEFLVDLAPFEDVVQQVQTGAASAPSQGDHTVDVITAGRRPPNPTDLIESGQMEDLLWKARDTYDLVVIDTPPTTVVSDAVPLLSRASGVIVVTRLGRSTRKAAESLQQQLTHVGAPTLGVVVNGAGKSGDVYGYGYLADSPESRPDKSEKSEADDQPEKRKKVVRTKSSESESEQTVPSWIYNRLVVTGEEGALAEFVQRVEGEKDAETGEPVPLDFERHVPTAPELVPAPTGDKTTATAAPDNSDGWWHWNAMWPERNGKPENGKVVYLFASAWSPPQEWLAKASEEHPDLKFALEYVEEFCREAAGTRWEAGEQVETWVVDPDTADWVEYENPGSA